jgi:aminoglycoside phosphotransferase (APT) family kinase protein
MFNPNEHREKCEAYLGRFLESSASLIRAEMLTKSTRDAPWRLDVEVNGEMRSYVLRLESRGIEHEYRVLRAMESIPIPTPRVYGWDPEGEALDVPCFLCDYVEGESLLKPMLAGEGWAEELYLDAVCALQGITEEELAEVLYRLPRESAADVLEGAQEYFRSNPQPLTARVYKELKGRMPQLPVARFSNGDLWLDNFIVRDRQLAGVIDFTNAGFSDPIFEFLLSFFVSPELRDRGTEERYCYRIGYDPEVLQWYRGLECFDTLRWVLLTGGPFVHHTRESLERNLENWLDEVCR